MSVDIWVAAVRKLTDTDFELVELYNGLINAGIDAPKDLKKRIGLSLGLDRLYFGEEITTPENGIVETIVRGEGNVMYGEGMIVNIIDLPLNTIALRIYAEA